MEPWQMLVLSLALAIVVEVGALAFLAALGVLAYATRELWREGAKAWRI